MVASHLFMTTAEHFKSCKVRFHLISIPNPIQEARNSKILHTIYIITFQEHNIFELSRLLREYWKLSEL